MRSVRTAILIVVALVAVAMIWMLFRSEEAVDIVHPERRDVVELVIASGSLQAVLQSDIGSSVGGIVRNVLVREGDEVTAGQILLTLDREDIDRQIDQARLAIQTAETELARVRRPAREEDIARARAELAQATRVNQARLDQAKQRLQRMERGGRPEEMAQAQAALRQTQASRRQAELDLERAKQLYARGAIPRSDLDAVETRIQLAQAAEQSSEEQLALVRQPDAQEDIDVVRAEVRAARATLEESVRIAEQNLRGLLNIPRPEDVRVAEARLREVQSALRRFQEEADRRTIVAPFHGLIVKRKAEPGQSITPGTPLLTVADMSRTEVVLETDEANLPRLRMGQAALLIAPAYPERPFQGLLAEIGPEVNPARGVVILRIRPLELPEFARPDLTVDANIEVAVFEDALSIPATSVVTEDGQDFVMALQGDQLEKRPVRLLARGAEFIAVEGILENLPIAVRAGEVTPGKSVRVAGGR